MTAGVTKATLDRQMDAFLQGVGEVMRVMRQASERRALEAERRIGELEARLAKLEERP